MCLREIIGRSYLSGPCLVPTKEFNRFSAGSLDVTDNTAALVRQFSDNTKLIVTKLCLKRRKSFLEGVSTGSGSDLVSDQQAILLVLLDRLARPTRYRGVVLTSSH